jgi:hypothetical protein
LNSAIRDISNIEHFHLLVELLNKNLEIRIRVTGKSMFPFLRGNEMVTIKPARCSSLNKGDIILFQTREGIPHVHRLLRKWRGSNGIWSYGTMGDALFRMEGPIVEHQVLGRVSKIECACLGKKEMSVNLETSTWRVINCIIASIQFAKSLIYCALFPAPQKNA